MDGDILGQYYYDLVVRPVLLRLDLSDQHGNEVDNQSKNPLKIEELCRAGNPEKTCLSLRYAGRFSPRLCNDGGWWEKTAGPSDSLCLRNVVNRLFPGNPLAPLSLPLRYNF